MESGIGTCKDCCQSYSLSDYVRRDSNESWFLAGFFWSSIYVKNSPHASGTWWWDSVFQSGGKSPRNQVESKVHMYLCSMYTYLVQKCSLKMPGSFIRSKMLAKTKKSFLTEEKWKVLSYLRNPMYAQCLPLSSHRLFQRDPKHGKV